MLKFSRSNWKNVPILGIECILYIKRSYVYDVYYNSLITDVDYIIASTIFS